MRASWAAKRALDRYPRVTFTAARAPFLWEFVVRMMRGEVMAPRDATGPVRAPLQALKWIARAAGA